MRARHPAAAARSGAHRRLGRSRLVADDGFQAQADWESLRSPETYLGYEQAQNFASPGFAADESRTYRVPEPLNRNEWALEGDWTIGAGASVPNGADGRLAFRFHARDAHLVMGPRERGTEVPFRVLLDGDPPGPAHGFDVDEDGHGTLSRQRLHQLIRQHEEIRDRTLEISFPEAGAEAYCFTFG